MFPACQHCNSEARQGEQALAVMVRMQLTPTETEQARSEHERLLKGMANNNPDIVKEWLSVTRNQNRRFFRASFGALGDELRNAGFEAANYGKLTEGTISRFMVKLGKALYYKHAKTPFSGIMYAHHFNPLASPLPESNLEKMLSLTPITERPARSSRSLADQFIYRFNYTPEAGLLYAVVQFSEQFVFRLALITDNAVPALEERARELGKPLSPLGRYECRIGEDESVLRQD